MAQAVVRGACGRPLGGFMRAVLIVVAIGVSATPLRAQVSTFDLSGVIKDEQGAVLPGVTVTMRNEATGLTRSVASGVNGNYYFANLPPQGTWELTTDL